MINDALGDRMKRYEAVSKTSLVSRMPVIIRLDGVAFHTFTKGFEKPFDNVMIQAMQKTMKYLCEKIQGCVLGYTQSDEITLVLVDYKKLNSDSWYGNEVQKMASVSAAMATYAFNKYFNELHLERIAKNGEADKYDLAHDTARKKGAFFDSRVFNVPKEDITNNVYWRQTDAERNSINSLAQSLFSHKSLQGLNIKETLTKIEQEKGIIWGNLPTTYKRGSCCIKALFIGDDKVTLVGGDGMDEDDYRGDSGKEYVDTIGSNLNFTKKWYIDNNIPKFKDEGREYIENLVYAPDED